MNTTSICRPQREKEVWEKELLKISLAKKQCARMFIPFVVRVKSHPSACTEITITDIIRGPRALLMKEISASMS